MCVVGSLLLEHTPSAPPTPSTKGKRLGQHACIERAAQGQREGGMHVLGVLEIGREKKTSCWGWGSKGVRVGADVGADEGAGIVGRGVGLGERVGSSDGPGVGSGAGADVGAAMGADEGADVGSRAGAGQVSTWLSEQPLGSEATHSPGLVAPQHA